jgi:predicted transcriptional regulator
MSIPSLANAELAVMELLWEVESLTARDLREQLYPGSTKAQHGTVQRLLQRLESKGYVARDRSGPAHLFEAQIGRESYAASQLESLASKLTGGSLSPLITQLLQDQKISDAEIMSLRSILDEARRSGRPS